MLIGEMLKKRYKITSHLGEGGMGEVYLAADKQTQQQVAVKMLARQLSAYPEALERFRREAETLRKLNHPNIVKFIDAFEHKTQYIIVMEYVSGGGLYQLVKAGPLPMEVARRIALELCDALIRAHYLNIIHRDIKPENVLIDQDGTPKLADFGVARLNEVTRMTRSGTQVGTPYYMAPEAWEGKQLDAQADIWSLGVMLFEMLAGQVPFDGDTPLAVMNKVHTAALPDLDKLRAEVPGELVRVVNRMLTREKAQRYQTMREVAVDLERLQLAAPLQPAAENLEFSGKATRVITEPDSAEKADQQKSEHEAAEKAKRERAEREAKERAAGQKVIQEVAEKAKRERAERWAAQIAALKETLSQSFHTLKLALPKAMPFIRIAGTIGIGLVLLWLVSRIAQIPLPTRAAIAGTPVTVVPAVELSTEAPSAPTETANTLFVEISTLTPLAQTEITTTPSVPERGGANKIAFVANSEIWVMNVDGSDLKKLTQDSGSKSDLHWLPDGERILFLGGDSIQYNKTIRYFDVSAGAVNVLTTFSSEFSSVTAFQVSPDGKQVMLALSNNIWIVPFDFEAFKSITNRNQLTHIEGACIVPASEGLAASKVRDARWSFDNKMVAWLYEGIYDPNPSLLAEQVSVLDIENCNLDIMGTFPSALFTPKGYEDRKLRDFDWDGKSRFVFNTVERNDGWGYLYIYDWITHIPTPIFEDTCCYRDARWSPDGNYLFFAFQEFAENAPTLVYYVPYSEVATSANLTNLTPLPLPEWFFQNPKEAPQPALRPVQQ